MKINFVAMKYIFATFRTRLKKCSTQEIIQTLIHNNGTKFHEVEGLSWPRTQAPPSFSTLHEKITREPGKTYHVSDVVGGTNLFA